LRKIEKDRRIVEKLKKNRDIDFYGINCGQGVV